MLREAQTRHVLMANFAGVFAFSLRQSFYPLYLTSLGMPKTLIGLLISTQALCSMISRPVLGAATARFGSTRVLAAAMTFTSIGVASTVALRTFWPLAAAIGLTGVGMGLLAPLSMSLIAGRAAPDAQGVAAGLRVSAMQFAQLTSPLLCGLAVGMFGLNAAFAVGAAVAAGGLVPVMMLQSRRRLFACAEAPSAQMALLDDVDTRIAAERSGQRGGHGPGDGR
jgi:MFS family permease